MAIMKNTETADFNALLDVTWEIYPTTLSIQAKRLYWETLKQFDLADVKGAISRHIQNPDNGQFPPKPADIIRLIRGSTQTASAIAWSKLLRAIKYVGPHKTIIFDDPIIHAVVQDMGGWIAICEISEKETPFVAKDFERRYAGYALREKIDYPRQLTGISDAHNANNTFERGEPIAQIAYFGDLNLAKLVHQQGGNNKPQLVHIAKSLPKVGA